MRPVDQEHGFAINFDCTLIAPRAKQILEMVFPHRLVRRMPLFLKNVVVASVPAPRPGFIGPGETKRKIKLPGFQHHVGRRFQ